MALDVLVLAAVVLLHLWLCPYAKVRYMSKRGIPLPQVEESFNLQAIHDLLVLGPLQLESFDHLFFPGVVPRTFIGAMAVAGLSWPIHAVLHAAGAPKFALQYVVRGVLGLLLVWSFWCFRRAVAKSSWGKDTAVFLSLVTACQFHLPFYMTRTLPNTFALALVLHAYASLLQDRPGRCTVMLALATALFRCDVIVLAAPLLLSLLLRAKIGFVPLVVTGCLAGLLSIGVTVAIDSFFWKRWLWPEGVVLFFNTVENRSSEWGESPPHWYFTSALPRALLTTALLIPVGLTMPSNPKAPLLPSLEGLRLDKEVAWLLAPVLTYIGLYSILPHKELRFIFHALPLLNLVSAIGLAKLYRRRTKSILPFLLGMGLLLASFVLTLPFLAASYHNYPGGRAFTRLHQLVPPSSRQGLSVHIDVYPAENGVSRFGEENGSATSPSWEYSKAEGLAPSQLLSFDYLLTGSHLTSTPSDSFQVIEWVEGFDRIKWRETVAALREEVVRGGFDVKGLMSVLRTVVGTKPKVALLKRIG